MYLCTGKDKLITGLSIVIVTRKYHVSEAGYCYWGMLYNSLILEARELPDRGCLSTKL